MGDKAEALGDTGTILVVFFKCFLRSSLKCRKRVKTKHAIHTMLTVKKNNQLNFCSCCFCADD